MKDLASLKVENNAVLTKLFETLYHNLYSEEKAPFNWKIFREKGLLHENGEDFISRLVNINFKELPTPKYDKFMELKNDPAFQKESTDSEYAGVIIELADWT